MTPLAEARLYGRAIRRFNTTSEKLDAVVETLYGWLLDPDMKVSVRLEAAKALIAAESLNQKDEHKILSLMSPNGTTEQERNRFLEPARRVGVVQGDVGIRST